MRYGIIKREKNVVVNCMKYSVFTLSILVFCTFVFAYFVTFKSEVSVFPGAVFMKELVEETDVDTPTLEKIIVAYVANGTKLTLNKKYLVNLLKRYVGAIDAKIDDTPVLIKADKTAIENVVTFKKIIEKDKVSDLILEELYKYYPLDTKFNLKWQAGNIVEHDDYTITIQLSNKALPFVRIALRKSNRIAGYLTFQYEAILLRKVGVAKRKIERGEVIGINDVEFLEQNIYTMNKIPVFYEDLPIMADKVFQKGEILDAKYTKDVPNVIKGQILKAISIVGGVRVSTLVQALENGYVGNVINVKNLDTGMIIKGIVQEDGTVVVLEVK